MNYRENPKVEEFRKYSGCFRENIAFLPNSTLTPTYT